MFNVFYWTVEKYHHEKPPLRNNQHSSAKMLSFAWWKMMLDEISIDNNGQKDTKWSTKFPLQVSHIIIAVAHLVKIKGCKLTQRNVSSTNRRQSQSHSLSFSLRDSNRSQFNPWAAHVYAHAWPHAHVKVWTWYIWCELIVLAKSSTDQTKSYNIY